MVPISKQKRRKNNPVSGNGFTLVEILVAVTIFSLVAVGLATSFFSGMKLWARAQASDLPETIAILELEAIAKELRQAIDIPEIGFEGSAGKISFPSLAGTAIVKIAYRFDPQEKALLRSQTGFKDVIAKKEEQLKEEKKVLSLEEISLRYLYFDPDKKVYIWKDGWPKENGVFFAVQMNGKVHGKEISKTVFIPIS